MTSSSVYSVSGKYRNGKEISKYQISSLNGSKLDVNKRQLCFLIGAGLVDNCTVSFVKQGVVFRGNGIDLRDLPEYNVDTSYKVISELTVNYRVVGFEVRQGDVIKKLKLEDVFNMMKSGTLDKKYPHEVESKNMNNGAVIKKRVISLSKQDLAISMQYKDDISGLGKLELISAGKSASNLDDKKVKSCIKTHTTSEYRIVTVFGDTVRLTNNIDIIDIVVEGVNLRNMSRADVLKIVAIGMLKYDTGSRVVSIQLNDLENQRLATYNYRS